MKSDRLLSLEEKMKTAPEEHPLEYATLCRIYAYDDKPTYVTTPAYDAFTYPEYDKDRMAFVYRHYDMEAETMDHISRDLIDLIDGFDGDIKNENFIQICNLFQVPEKHIQMCHEEYWKLDDQEI